jgi:DNA-directed RNA polymerase specialized sigma24 family protein
MAESLETRRALNAAMERYADGDDAAFEEIYDLLTPRLVAFFMRQVEDATRAEELVERTLLQMHAARRHYLRGSDVVPWAYAIGRHVLGHAASESDGHALVHEDGLSVEDAAEVLGTSSVGVGTGVRSIYQALRAVFAGRGRQVSP